jgi:hypothetical protein
VEADASHVNTRYNLPHLLENLGRRASHPRSVRDTPILLGTAPGEADESPFSADTRRNSRFAIACEPSA